MGLEGRFTDSRGTMLGGVMFTLAGLPFLRQEPNGERTKLPPRLRDVREHHYTAYVSLVFWYVGIAMLVVGAVGHVAKVLA